MTNAPAFLKIVAIKKLGRLAASSVMLLAASASFSVLSDEAVLEENNNLHEPFSALLSEHVKTIDNGASTQVNYDGFKQNRARLTQYLNSLAKVEKSTFDSWSKADQLAFLINAYNAYTIDLILTQYPDLDSIRDLGGFFSSPWKKEVAPLLGKTLTLDEIEHEFIRGQSQNTKGYNEPRIHFAVNCASIGCPALREEAYVGEKLDSQLDAQTQRFLADTSRNRMDGNTLKLSKIFDWYGEDFENNAGRESESWQGAKNVNTENLSQFLLLYKDALNLSEPQVLTLEQEKAEIEFLDYDWALNDTQ
ncbi:DUF547 domain-containing protein [Alteromonas sp. IB21]|uniref:DUF547 domain-containing protein n=1 Tax=Alteromonas sp. IB21 TaxID=2779369 RepID=UPI0018E731EF|nr:DUF547 domain-containing protein [Alteromonas sp. IB21]MBJ2130241.1 DUF547 domain-containing protein [Alteromonas sp. IB21]